MRAIRQASLERSKSRRLEIRTAGSTRNLLITTSDVSLAESISIRAVTVRLANVSRIVGCIDGRRAIDWNTVVNTTPSWCIASYGAIRVAVGYAGRRTRVLEGDTCAISKKCTEFKAFWPCIRVSRLSVVAGKVETTSYIIGNPQSIGVSSVVVSRTVRCSSKCGNR